MSCSLNCSGDPSTSSCLTACRRPSPQAELPPQDDQSRWHPPADDKDNGSFFSGFRSYRGDAVAAVAAATATANAASAAPSSTVNAALGVDCSVATALGDNGAKDGDSETPQKDVAGVREVGARGAEGLAFHHFPIPDLSPAENTKFLAGLVDELESLVVSGKVGGTNLDFGLISCCVRRGGVLVWLGWAFHSRLFARM